MANTYTLIASNVLSGTTSNVTFSSIPSTYTDLVLRISSRTDSPNIGSYFTYYYNSNTSTRSVTYLERDNANVVASFRDTTNEAWGGSAGGTATSNTFGSAEIYIPNYTGTINKPSSAFGTGESNSTTGSRTAISANLTQITSAVTSVSLIGGDGSFVSGSSFYLYGIKNA